MSKDAKKALGKSIEAFDDISGITINKSTGNIVSGNHRWTEVLNKYPKDELAIKKLKGEYHTLEHKSKFTGFIVRIVDWSESKELAANVAANSQLIQGEFTSSLQSVLEEISIDMSQLDLMADLRLDELKIDMDGLDDIDLDFSDYDDSEEEARKANDDLQASTKPEQKEAEHIQTTISLLVPTKRKAEIENDIYKFLAGMDYGEDVIVS